MKMRQAVCFPPFLLCENQVAVQEPERTLEEGCANMSLRDFEDPVVLFEQRNA